MAYYNSDYTYPDMFLWQDETYRGCMNEAGPVFLKIAQLLEKEQRENGRKDYFPGRTDLARDSVNRAPYFTDYLEEWKAKGMHFSCSGMMGEVMAPDAIQNHEVYQADVLYIPFVSHREDSHEAMNLLAENADVLETAAKQNILVQFADCMESWHGAMIEKVIESQGTFRLSYRPIYLDISVLVRNGLTMGDVLGAEADNWPRPTVLAGRTVVEISDKLEMKQVHQHNISQIYRRNQPEWDFDRHIRSMAAKRQAEGMRLEYFCRDSHDPGMESFWKERGIRCEDHFYGHDWYITLTPECAFRQPEHKLPLLLVMKEPRTACPASTQTAFQFYYDFIELCAQGEFMMLFFALESPEDNDEVLPGILSETAANYPVEVTRVYLTGQSHNGYYALEFYRRHPKLIAAAATLCDPVGLQTGAVLGDTYRDHAAELIASFRKYDYPLININGNLENSYCKDNRAPEKIDDDVFYFQNRLAAFRLPMRSREEILGARTSPDYATRRNGVPSDRTEVRFDMGREAYVSDFRNEDGKWFFRYISLENTPHMIMPQMAELSWEFIRRFARNTETGETIELY